jgi:hypothetical protein
MELMNMRLIEYISDTAISKQNYINKKNEENADILEQNGFTEEQIETIEWLCSVRHKLHSMDAQSVFNVYSSDYDEFNKYIDDGNTDINVKLMKANLPKVKFTYDYYEDMPNSSWYGFDYEGYDEYQDWFENSDNFYEFCNMKEQLNTDIENYLENIDSQYGTHYCPTGIARGRYGGIL